MWLHASESNHNAIISISHHTLIWYLLYSGESRPNEPREDGTGEIGVAEFVAAFATNADISSGDMTANAAIRITANGIIRIISVLDPRYHQ